MINFANFSNAARKSYTRQQYAKLAGNGSSYVDKIQTARRGSPSPIDSPHYISRSPVMTHPQDNTVLVASQKAIAPLGSGTRSNEHGMRFFRPIDKDKGYKNGRLLAGNIVEGDRYSVAINTSDAPLVKKRYLRKQTIATIHTHPTSPTKPELSQVPSIPDLRLDYENRQRNRHKDFESLILTTPKGKNPQTRVTAYRQEIEIPKNISDDYKSPYNDVAGTAAEIAALGGQYKVY
jgi:hypothetical protein